MNTISSKKWLYTNNPILKHYTKINTPYIPKFSFFSYPILTGAKYGPTEKDIDNALREGFNKGQKTVTRYVENEYIKHGLLHPGEEMTAQELYNRVYNNTNLGELGPEVESTNISPEPIRKKYTVSSPVESRKRSLTPQPKKKRATVETINPPTPISKEELKEFSDKLIVSKDKSSPSVVTKNETETELMKLRAKNTGKKVEDIEDKKLINKMSLTPKKPSNIPKPKPLYNPKLEKILTDEENKIRKIGKKDLQTIKEGQKFLDRSKKQKLTKKEKQEIDELEYLAKANEELEENRKKYLAKAREELEDKLTKIDEAKKIIKLGKKGIKKSSEPKESKEEIKESSEPKESKEEIKESSEPKESKEEIKESSEPKESKKETIIIPEPKKSAEEIKMAKDFLNVNINTFTKEDMERLIKKFDNFDERSKVMINSYLGKVFGNYYNDSNKDIKYQIIYFFIADKIPGLPYVFNRPTAPAPTENPSKRPENIRKMTRQDLTIDMIPPNQRPTLFTGKFTSGLVPNKPNIPINNSILNDALMDAYFWAMKRYNLSNVQKNTFDNIYRYIINMIATDYTFDKVAQNYVAKILEDNGAIKYKYNK